MTPEQRAQQGILLAAAGAEMHLFRNNVGALPDPRTGRLIRFGLANESAELNRRLKSADLIGVRRVTITPDMVGQTIGQLCSVECKPPGWVYSGTPRERAQLAWAEHVRRWGGFAVFATSGEDLTLANGIARLSGNLTGAVP